MRTTQKAVAALSGALLITLGLGTPVHAQEKTLTFAAGPQGSVNYVIASSIATLLARNTGAKVTVVPFQGTTALLPAVARGEAPVAANDAGSVYEGYSGTGQFKTAYGNLRLLSAGSMQQVAIAVRADSDIKTAADIKGKRVTAQFAALPVCKQHSDATLANLGLTWADVRPVPVTTIVQASQALADDRVDVMTCAAPGIATLREAHAKNPLRFISIDPAPQAMEKARSHYPYLRDAQTLPAKAFGWLPNQASFLAYPWYLYGNADLDEKTVSAILGVMWDKNEEMRQMHPIFLAWTTKAMTTTEPVLPYHPAAIAFYKAKGVWTAEMDAAQAAVLARK